MWKTASALIPVAETEAVKPGIFPALPLKPPPAEPVSSDGGTGNGALPACPSNDPREASTARAPSGTAPPTVDDGGIFAGRLLAPLTDVVSVVLDVLVVWVASPPPLVMPGPQRVGSESCGRS